ncbi:MAG: PAS domain S-box protein [Syntrophobacteraceae bacterium]
MTALFSSLRMRLMLLVFLAILPALGLILYSGLEQRKQAIVNAEHQAAHLLMHISLYQDRLIEGTIQLLESLIQVPQVKKLEDCSEIFSGILNKHVQFTNIGLVDAQGNLRATGIPVQNPTNVADRSYVKEALLTNRLFISEYLVGHITRVPSLVVSCPVIDETGETRGVLYAGLDLQYLSALAALEPLPSNSTISITDTWGTILYNSRSPEELLGKPFSKTEILGLALGNGLGMTQSVGPGGKMLLHAYHPISNLAAVGYVFIELDQESILVVPNQILERNLIGLGIVAGLAILASWLLGSALVTKKLTILGDAANLLAQGDLSVRTGLGAGTDEIDRLAFTIDRMAEALQQREAQRQQAEAALKASEEKYRLIVETANEGICVMDEQYNIVFVNWVMAAMVGHTPNEIIGRPASDFIFTEDHQAHVASMERRLKGIEEKFERRLRHKDGHAIWTLVSAVPIFDDVHEVTGGFAMFIDITDRKQAETATAESREKFEALFQFAPEAIFLEKTSGEIIDCNKAAEEMTGYPREQLVGMSIAQLIPEEIAATLPEISRELNVNGEYSMESMNVRKNGEVFPAQVSIKLMELNGEETLIVIVRDLSERKRMESELLRVQKLESLGVLAGGIAHDFNNILTAVVGNISLARMYAKDDAKVIRRLEEAENASMRARDLTFQLLTFSRGGTPIKEVVSLAEIVRQTSEFVMRGANAGCCFDLPEDLWQVEADPGQISQVMNNIVINAIQAMPDGGIIKIMARNMEAGQDLHLPISPGRYVRISVEDSGIGISKEHIPKIFDPYFTTKQDGSGLGLASSYAIVHKHGGYIAVESEPGAGTAFEVYLPAADVVIRPTGPEEKRLPGKSGRVLIVDDEKLILDVAGAMLTQLGCEVAFATEGSSAIDMYKEARSQGKPFDAVILDLTIPGGLGGKETIRYLLEIDPDVRAIVSSGYSNDPVMANFEEYGFRGFVSKPYRISDLSDVLRKVLN